jgi:hypothetical protein
MPETNDLEAAADTVARATRELIATTAFHGDARDIAVNAGNLYYAITGEQLTTGYPGITNHAEHARCKLAKLAARIMLDMIEHAGTTDDETQLGAFASAIRLDPRVPEAAMPALTDIAGAVVPALMTVMSAAHDGSHTSE